jgi:hypothetical protein
MNLDVMQAVNDQEYLGNYNLNAVLENFNFALLTQGLTRPLFVAYLFIHPDTKLLF